MTNLVLYRPYLFTGCTYSKYVENISSFRTQDKATHMCGFMCKIRKKGGTSKRGVGERLSVPVSLGKSRSHMKWWITKIFRQKKRSQHVIKCTPLTWYIVFLMTSLLNYVEPIAYFWMSLSIVYIFYHTERNYKTIQIYKRGNRESRLGSHRSGS